MYHHIKRSIPVQWKHAIKNRLLQLYAIICRYHLQCNICGWRAVRFDDDGWHDSTRCPNCGSGIRHRLFWAIVTHVDELHINRLFKGKSILHFAPEKYFRSKIQAICKEYRTADACVAGYEKKAGRVDAILDISHIPSVADASVDCVIAFDVLEHVEDDIQAMAEIYRILRKDGSCILSVPQQDHLAHTYEDQTITEPDKRKQAYGQADHLRIYGDDFEQRLKNSGFVVTMADEHMLPASLVQRHILFPPVLSTDPFATNYRKIYFGKKA